VDEAQMPSEPLALAYLSAVVLQAEAAQKQHLLESINTSQFFARLISAYRREVALLDVMLTPPIQDNQSPFSVN
jgi:hypothetical protein